jgi:uncharacterized protein (TIGR02147 family)
MKAERTAKSLPFYKLCLQRALANRCSRNPRYSTRAFARALGVDHAALSRFLSGERVPSYKVALKILKNLDLSPSEEQEFLSSIAQIRKQTLQRVSPVFKKMPSVPETKELSLELFRVISDWYHYAILELTFVNGFKSDPKWIAKELGISVAETKMALDRLLQLELLENDENGSLRKSLGHITTADKHITNSALKLHQKQILQRAIESLENEPIETRSMTSMTMAINPEKLPVARQMIEEFTQNLCQFLEADKRKQVYELGICLYPVQKK